MENLTPYDGTMIFKPVEPLADVIAKAEAKRQDKNDPLAAHYADGSAYKSIYAEALKRLSRKDMLTVADAAARLGITPADFEKKAAAGEALLIEIEGKKVVPDCIFGKDDKIDPLKIDIAREFVLEGVSYFRFLDYLKFMNLEKANVPVTIPEKQLRAVFKSAALAGYNCSITAYATMNQLADGRDTHSTFFDLLIKKLDAALIHGGWDSTGGLSRPFRDKYNIPGLTIEEERSRIVSKPKKPHP